MPAGKADLHIHTRVSDGMASVAQTLEHAEFATDLDVVAITDHEDIAGGLQARELAAQRGYRVEVVPGVEITTRHGHLLILDVEENPPVFRSVERTLEWAHAHGGLAVAPHPTSRLTRSMSIRTMDRICLRGEAGITLDAIELANPSPAGREGQRRAATENVRWRLPVTGGSDAHHLPHMGTGWTEFPGSTARELVEALRCGHVQGRQSAYPSFRTVGTWNIAAGLAWGYMATPRKLGRRVAARRTR